MRIRLICLLGLAGLAGCERRIDQGPVVVSVIGAPPSPADPSTAPLSEPGRVLMAATAQGLVRFDASGQVEPALAERWIVIDDGMSYIFRLREAQWRDGAPVTASAVVRALKAVMRRDSANRLRPYLAAIDEVVEMTPQVIEIRLRSPRPELLKLLAQPEMALFDRRTMDGSGPFDIASVRAGMYTLTPTPDLTLLAEERPDPDPRRDVILRGERPAKAVARFAERGSDLVLGGTALTLPLLDTIELPPDERHIGTTVGLFGLAIVEREGFLAEAEHRAAISMAIDRGALTTVLGGGLRPIETVLPQSFESARSPVAPDWAAWSPTQRRQTAAARVAAWRSAHPDMPPIRLALPDQPGSNLIAARITVDLSAIGLEVRRVGEREDADLRLIDRVAPHDNARWFLAEACQPCGEVAEFALEAAREAPTLAERAGRIAEADTAVEADTPFIPLSQPLRWSLVSRRLRAWAPNPRDVHPLNHLRSDPN